MSSANDNSKLLRFPVLRGLLPIKGSQFPLEVLAGLTLAALAIPEVMGYTKISGTPVITGLYTMIVPMLLFAFIGSSRHLVVSADSATAAILAAGLVGLANSGSNEYMALAAVLAIMAGVFVILALAYRAFAIYYAAMHHRDHSEQVWTSEALFRPDCGRVGFHHPVRRAGGLAMPVPGEFS